MKDLFSTGSVLYQQARPSYSAEVVDSILQHVAVRELAWDCGVQVQVNLPKVWRPIFNRF